MTKPDGIYRLPIRTPRRATRCSSRVTALRSKHVGAVTLLWIDLDPVAFMLGARDIRPGYAVERLDAAFDDHWMHRFLGRGLVECLPPSSLQSVFRAFEPISVCGGEIVVREGDRADVFYVIANGSAEVRRDGRRLVALLARGFVWCRCARERQQAQRKRRR